MAMHEFFSVQAGDPFDPAPTLIWADWLEEQGDATGAATLRGLVEGGTPSLHALALRAAPASAAIREPDGFEHRFRGGGTFGFTFGSAFGVGFGDGVEKVEEIEDVDAHGCGGADGFGVDGPDELGVRIADGFGDEHGPKGEFENSGVGLRSGWYERDMVPTTDTIPANNSRGSQASIRSARRRCRSRPIRPADARDPAAPPGFRPPPAPRAAPRRPSRAPR